MLYFKVNLIFYIEGGDKIEFTKKDQGQKRQKGSTVQASVVNSKAVSSPKATKGIFK